MQATRLWVKLQGDIQSETFFFCTYVLRISECTHCMVPTNLKVILRILLLCGKSKP